MATLAMMFSWLLFQAWKVTHLAVGVQQPLPGHQLQLLLTSTSFSCYAAHRNKILYNDWYKEISSAITGVRKKISRNLYNKRMTTHLKICGPWAPGHFVSVFSVIRTVEGCQFQDIYLILSVHIFILSSFLHHEEDMNIPYGILSSGNIFLLTDK